jgi:hypothetical protein
LRRSYCGFAFFISTLHAAHLPEQTGIGFAFSAKKNWRFAMFLSGYIFAFVIGVAVGSVFSTVILFGNRLDQIP